MNLASRAARDANIKKKPTVSKPKCKAYALNVNKIRTAYSISPPTEDAQLNAVTVITLTYTAITAINVNNALL